MTMAKASGARRSVSVGDLINFGRFRQGDRNRDRDIKALEWLVLDVRDDRMLLITKQGIDVKWFHKSSRSVTWETCTLRTRFLNGYFLDTAFRPAERKRIVLTTVTADPNPETETDPGRDTQDKVFLLSTREAELYFRSNRARQCYPTDYAWSRGANSWGPYHESFSDRCWWWLRTPGWSNKYAAGVNLDGNIRYGGDGVRGNGNCVRPALWLRLE